MYGVFLKEYLLHPLCLGGEAHPGIGRLSWQAGTRGIDVAAILSQMWEDHGRSIYIYIIYIHIIYIIYIYEDLDVMLHSNFEIVHKPWCVQSKVRCDF